MKPTFLKVGVPRNTVRPPGTVRAPTETPGAANVPIPQFSHQKESPGPTHTINLPDYAVGDLVFIAYQLNTTGHSVTSGWTALMGPTVTNGNELTVIARVMESGDGTLTGVAKHRRIEAANGRTAELQRGDQQTANTKNQG